MSREPIWWTARPVYDIKPYLPYADSYPEAVDGFDGKRDARAILTVVFPPELEAMIPEEKREGLRQAFACGRSRSARSGAPGFNFAGFVRFHPGWVLTVVIGGYNERCVTRSDGPVFFPAREKIGEKRPWTCLGVLRGSGEAGPASTRTHLMGDPVRAGYGTTDFE